jgi:beta-phosphoglucomutase-like phosphatase (HAD superfamily)
LLHLKSVVFDWAGTMVDHGSLAPMGVFVEAFRRFGIEITVDEARGPMGMANCWTVGVAVTGNLFGLSLSDTEALSAGEFASRRHAAVAQLTTAGAHYVIDGVADLVPVLGAIEGRLARGERP